MLKNKGKSKKEILMLGGCLTLRRTMLVPADDISKENLKRLIGAKTVFPLDELLGINGIPFKATCSMVCGIVKTAIKADSYDEASELIKEKYSFDVSPSQAKRMVDYVGALVYADDQAKANRSKEFINRSPDDISGEIDDTLYIQFDGSFYLERIEDGPGCNWKECKIAIAFKDSDLVHWANSTEVKAREIVGYIGSVDEFQYYLLALGLRKEVDRYKNAVIITDGAKYILPLVKKLFPGRKYILDKYHAIENGVKYANAVVRGKKKKEELGKQIVELINLGDPISLLELLKPYSEKKLPPGVVNFYEYVLRLQECMYYALYEEQGFIVGSGHIESCHRYTVQDRLKNPGQEWNRDNGQGVLSLKARLESRLWNQVEELVRADYEYCRKSYECNEFKK